ncbi:hypothetical protein [Thermococcus sp.]|uniref:hypothetical protein n=1 Tax=Thermococcus sp. TaxID=35749 RepID=UPI0026387918|nr:hypothetical protein [Thermococcus sp.]
MRKATAMVSPMLPTAEPMGRPEGRRKEAGGGLIFASPMHRADSNSGRERGTAVRG